MVWWWLEGISQFYVCTGLIVVRNILRVMHRHSGDERFLPAVLAWEAFWKVTLFAPWVASESSKIFKVRNWTSVWDSIRFAHGASPPRLSGRTCRDMSIAPASVRDRLSPTREGKLQCKVCLHPHLEQGGTSPVERWHLSLFFPPLLQMGAKNPSLTPLNCILKNWDRFDP